MWQYKEQIEMSLETFLLIQDNNLTVYILDRVDVTLVRVLSYYTTSPLKDRILKRK